MSELFTEILPYVKNLSNYLHSVKELPFSEKQKFPFLNLLFQDDEILALTDTLLRIVPITSQNIEYKSKSLERARLSRLVERLAKLKSILPEVNYLSSFSQKELDEILLWSFQCENFVRFSIRPWQYDYFDLILDELTRASSIEKIQLQTCELLADKSKVYINLAWRGPFKNTEYILIPNVAEQFWNVVCETRDRTLPLNALRYLLYLQVAVTWGDNRLPLGAVSSDGILTASVQLLQANAQEYSKDQPLSETSWQSVSDYIVQQVYPLYSEISLSLEVRLSEELELGKRYVEQGLLESKYVEQIQEWINNLARFRNDYLEEITGLK